MEDIDCCGQETAIYVERKQSLRSAALVGTFRRAGGKKNQKLKHHQGKIAIKKPLLIPEKKNGSILFIIIAFCIPVLLYLQTLNFGYTHFDDDLLIINNVNFLSNFGNVFRAFLTDQFIVKITSFYRPVGTLSYMLDILISGGSNAWMYHLSNILIFGLTSCLLFLLLRRFLIPPKLALLSTLIYYTHPLFVSSVSFIPNRAELLLALFSLLSLLLLIDFLQNRKVIYLFLHWAAFTIALFCKETAAFLPFLFIMYYFIFTAKKRFEKKYLFFILLYAVSGIFWFWLRTKAIGGISNRSDTFALTAILSNLKTITESLAKFFFYFDFAPLPGFSIFKTLAGMGIIVLIVILFFKSKERSKKEKAFCFTWFLLLMLPTILYNGGGLTDYLDHHFFISMIGILLFLLFIFPKKWLVKGDIKRTWLFIAVIVFLSSFSFIKSRAYSDPYTYYSSAVSCNPNSAFAFFCLGNEKKAKGDLQGAVEDYNKAIAIKPDYASVYLNRGNIKKNKSDFKGAIDDYTKTIAMIPNSADAYNNMGAVLGMSNNFNDALINFNKAIEINPKYIDAYNNRALVKYCLKNFTGATEDCDKALKLDSKDETALNLKAQVQKELRQNSH